MLPRKKAAAPEPGDEWLPPLVLRDHDHEGGQVTVHGPETKVQPGSHTRASGKL